MVKSLSEITQPFDYIVFAHKAMGQDAVASQIQSAIDANTTLVIIQNGVGNEEPFRRLYPESTIVSCVVCLPCLSLGIQILTNTDVGWGNTGPTRDDKTQQIGRFTDRTVRKRLERHQP